MKSTKKLTVIWIIIAIATLVGGFFWGKSVGASGAAATRTGGSGRFAFASSTFAGRGGYGAGTGAASAFTTGQVLSITGNSLTLQLANGNSENVFFSSSTQVIVPQPASISSVQQGATVLITGTTNSDGSVTASTIQLRSTTTPSTASPQ